MTLYIRSGLVSNDTLIIRQVYHVGRQEMNMKAKENELRNKFEDGENPIYFGAEYMGGHKAYPKKTDCDVRLFKRGLDIEFGKFSKKHITIYYDTITNIENMDEKRITKTRVVLLGLTVIGLIPALLWKKKFLYTVIEYKDEAGIEHAVVIDFHRQAEKAQQVIYQKMIEVKKLQ